MKLRRIRISRLPGIEDPFTVEGFSDGITVVVGPNGIGKSSLCRAMRHLIWPEELSRRSTSASALFENKTEEWLVNADGQPPRWQINGADTEAPPTPAAHLNQCFFLKLPDLIDSTQKAGNDVAAEIRRQMAGGFDLQAVASVCCATVGSQPGRAERKKLGEIQSKIRGAESEQLALSKKESRLDELAQQIAEADTATRRFPRVESATDLRKHRDELTIVEVVLQSMPSQLQSLSGEESAQIALIESELEQKSEQRRKAERELEKAISDMVATDLRGRIPQSELETVRRYAESLVDLDKELKQGKEDHEGKRRRLEQTRQACGGTDNAPETLGLQDASKLFAFLRECNNNSSQLTAIDEQLAILDKAIPLEHDPHRAELLSRGIASLRAWLSAPVPAAPQQNSVLWPSRNVIFVFAITLIAIGAVLGGVFHPSLFGIAGVGVGLAIAGLVFRVVASLRSDDIDVRRVRQSEFPSGLNAPDSWSVESVTARLREFERDLAADAAASQQAAYREADRARLNASRKPVIEERKQLHERRTALAQELGLKEIPADAELVDMARAMDHLRIAFQDEQGSKAEVEELENQRDDLLGNIASILRIHGVSAPTDGVAARAAVSALEARDQALSKAKDAKTNAEDRLEGFNRDIVKLEERKTPIYQRAGLPMDDRSGLDQLTRGLASYRENVGKKTGLVKMISTLESGLQSMGAGDLLELETTQLEAEKDRLTRLVEGGKTLRSEESDIRSEVKRAKASGNLEALIAERDKARETLLNRRDEALLAAAGQFLVAQVQKEYELNQMPRVLERARAFFGDFTHHAYELEVSQRDQESFVAIDATTRRGHKPNELSDGTRAQLLLASRLAFADEAEKGMRWPLFLDEALDQSDPARYEAIVRCLGRLAADDDRQIVYLTNDPTDVARIQRALANEGCDAAQIIDLAAVRRKERGVETAETLTVDIPPTVPLPGAMTPEQYGAELSVPPLDPIRGYRAQHLIYLLWDDLETLLVLLKAGIDRVGNWLLLSQAKAHLAVEVASAGRAGAQLDDRSQLLEAFCDAFAEGRGRTVDAQVIEGSSAVSGRFLTDVADICRELEGDGKRLIQALRTKGDPRLRGFRTEPTNSLESYLIEKGYIDQRPVLDEAEVLMRVLASPVAARVPSDLPGNFVHRWWQLAEGRAS